MLSLGRVMMGAGFAAAMMGSLKVYSLWFPQDRLPTINSIQFMIGVIGGLSAAKPTEIALRYLDWRELNTLFAGLTFLAAVIIIVVAPKHRAAGSGETLREQINGIGRIYSDQHFWRIVPWLFLSVGVSQGLATLYVVPWLTTVAEYSVGDAAMAQTWIVAMAIVNFALLGPLAEKMVKMGYGEMTLPVIGLGSSMVLMGLLTLQVQTGVVPIWMAWTMTIGATTLVFATFAKAFPAGLTGRVYTAFNLLGFLATAIVQWLIGRILDLFPDPDTGVATAEGYMWAFGILLAIQGAGAVWYVWATRTGFGAQTMLEKQAAE